MSDPEFNALAEAYESTLMIHADLMLKTMSMEQIKSVLASEYPKLITDHALVDLQTCIKKLGATT